MRKTLRHLTALLISLFVLFTFAACFEDEPESPSGPSETEQKLDMAAGDVLWTDANAIDTSAENPHAGEFAYKNKGTEELKGIGGAVEIDKFGEWDAVFCELGGLDLSPYKKLVIKAKATDAVITEEGAEPRTEPTRMLFKIESQPAIEGGDGRTEVTVELGADVKTYEFDLTYENYDLAMAGATKLTFIVGPGVKNYKTEITFEAVYFTDEMPVPENRVNQKGTVNPPLIYDGVSETFDVNRGFTSNDGHILVAESDGQSVVTVPVSKNEWELIGTKIQGNLKGFNTLRIVYTAPAGRMFKMKLEGAPGGTQAETKDKNRVPEGELSEEELHAGNGGQMTWEWQGFTEEALTDGPEMRLIIFPEPGKKVTEEFVMTIHELAFLNKDIETPQHIYDGKSESFDVNSQFEGDNHLETLVDAGKNIIRVKDGKDEWEAAKLTIGGNLKGFNALRIRYTLPDGKTVKLKLEGAPGGAAESTAPEEALHAGTGEEVTWEWQGFTAANLTDGAAMKLLIFPQPGEKNAGGDYDIVISELRLISAEAEVQPLVYNGTDETFNVNKNFKNGDGNIDVKEENNETILTVKPGKGSYETVITQAGGNLKGFNTLRMSFTAPAGKTMKLKFEGGGDAKESDSNEEALHAGTGEEAVWEWQGFTAANLTDGENGNMMKIIIFPEPGNGDVTEEYTIVIHELCFMTKEVEKPKLIYGGTDHDFNIRPGFMGDSHITVTEGDDGTVLGIKAGKGAWEAAKTEAGGNLKGFDTLRMVYTAPLGKKFMLKLDEGGVQAKEAEVREATGNREVWEWQGFTADNLTDGADGKMMKVLIFPEPGNEGITEDFDIVIHELTFTNEIIYNGTDEAFDILPALIANEQNILVSDGENGAKNITVTKSKGPWEMMFAQIGGNLKDFRKVKIVFTAPADTTLKLKAEGGGAAKESSAEEETANKGTGESVTWEFAVGEENLTDLRGMKLIIFPEPGKELTEDYQIVITELKLIK